MKSLFKSAACLAMVMVLLAPWQLVRAQAYPNKPIRIITGAPTGGSADIVARVIGAKLGEAWGQPVVVQNMPGASGVIAFSYVAKAVPDGYTILMGYDALPMVPFTMKSLPYDTVKDLMPVDQVSRTTMVLVARSTLPVKSLADLIALAKAQPGQLRFAEFGAPIWFPFELLNSMAGINIERVGYKERSTAVTDVMAGRVDVMFSSLVSMLGNIQSGKVRALAVAGQARSPALPDVPAIAETAGMQGYDFSSWLGLLVPAGTPPEIVSRLNGEIAKIVIMPDVQKQLSGQVELLNSTPDQFAALIKSDLAKWSTLHIHAE